MEFDQISPNGTDVAFEGDQYFKATFGKPGECAQCGETTRWMSDIMLVYICSEECARKQWEEYNEACK